MHDAAYYATHSPFSDPGLMAWWLDGADTRLPEIRRTATGLVFHYWAGGDMVTHGFAPERTAEIDLRYADTMLSRLHELDPAALDSPRRPADRIVGCCRDFALLLVTMARHHGIPARTRVGFATYLRPGWALDHVVAEVWDDHESRWRLVEAQLPEHPDFDVLDVPPDAFLTGPHAWSRCRAGEMDPERFVVAPETPDPALRSWPYLAHNLIHDLAALNKYEMLLWDTWGLLDRDAVDDPAHPVLDALAGLLLQPNTPLSAIRRAFAAPDFHVPPTITSASPATDAAGRVHLRVDHRKNP